MSTASMITLPSLPKGLHCLNAYSGASLGSAYTPSTRPVASRMAEAFGAFEWQRAHELDTCTPGPFDEASSLD
jgi:hypothetical protein